jgi:DNA-binding transcriptional regulator YiaG
MDPCALVEELLDEEIARQARFDAAGDPRAAACAWRIQYLEHLLGTLVQFPLTGERFVELLRANMAITNPSFPDVPHASVDLLRRWEARAH